MSGLILIGAFLVAGLLAFVANWLALIPWRRSKSLHWTEQARLLYPARLAASGNSWVIPANLALAARLVWPGTGPHWLLVASTAWFGCVFANFPFRREIYPAGRLPDWLHEIAGFAVLYYGPWFIVLSAIALMPDELNWQAWLLVLCLVGLQAAIAWGGLIEIGFKVGLFSSPPERLCELVHEVSVKTNVPVRVVGVWSAKIANAFAVPNSRSLIFTEQLLELLPDDELAAIIGHELAHIAEPKKDRVLRVLNSFGFLPLLFVNPLMHAFGALSCVFPPIVSLILLRPSTGLSRRLESRADEIASSHQREAGTYARALLRVSEYNLIPAVTSGKSTHPHLYDRLAAAGVVPDFPRPAAPGKMAWPCLVFCILLGMLVVATLGLLDN